MRRCSTKLRCNCSKPPLNQARTPLLSTLISTSQQDVSFHVPGHKRGSHGSTLDLFANTIGQDPLRYDLTEVPGLDMLSSPSGVIDEAQRLAAEAFGSIQTWFLVNGSTSGILASIMAVCVSGGPQDVILVARNCHLSAFSSFVLSGCTPRWVEPEVDEAFGVALGISPSLLEQRLKEETALSLKNGSKIRAVLVVSPSYFGTVSDIKGLARLCHQYDLPLIVDEAHGAHFSPKQDLPSAIPRSAISLGADVSIQSTHKTLSAMTQAAMLHLGSNRVDHNRISNSLRTIQSSSPSYILMASLDAARALFVSNGFMSNQIEFASYLRQELIQIPGIDLMGESNGYRHDPLRITIKVSRLGINGFQALEWLEQHHSVIVELATFSVLVCALGPGTNRGHCEALIEAVRHLSSSFSKGTVDRSSPLPTSKSNSNQTTRETSIARRTPREAFFSSNERVRVNVSIGRSSAELLCPYPPGVPVLFPGEEITREAIGSLRLALEMGGSITGASDKTLQTILVLT